MTNIQPVFAFGYAEARQGMSNRRSVKKNITYFYSQYNAGLYVQFFNLNIGNFLLDIGYSDFLTPAMLDCV
jgi:hypothetical protein